MTRFFIFNMYFLFFVFNFRFFLITALHYLKKIGVDKLRPICYNTLLLYKLDLYSPNGGKAMNLSLITAVILGLIGLLTVFIVYRRYQDRKRLEAMQRAEYELLEASARRSRTTKSRGAECHPPSPDHHQPAGIHQTLAERTFPRRIPQQSLGKNRGLNFAANTKFTVPCRQQPARYFFYTLSPPPTRPPFYSK